MSQEITYLAKVKEQIETELEEVKWTLEKTEESYAAIRDKLNEANE